MLRRFMLWLAVRLARKCGGVVVAAEFPGAVRGHVVYLWGTMNRSGFLRDGRYPGGRSVERDLRTRCRDLWHLDPTIK